MQMLPLVISVDAVSTDFREIELRNTLMMMFFATITNYGIGEITKNYAEMNFCGDFEGISCINENVISVEYTKFHQGNFNISALPHSTSNISITRCGQSFEILTRLFPRSLTEIRLHQNFICGSIDLQNLPEQLEYGVFYDNQIIGPIVLTGLPKSLKGLNLSHNRISQTTVFYENLPKSVEWISLAGSIQEARAIRPADKVTNKNIFATINKKKVY